MKIHLFLALVSVLAVSGCSKDSSGSARASEDTFVNTVNAIASTTPDDTEPGSIDNFPASTPDNTEPSSL